MSIKEEGSSGLQMAYCSTINPSTCRNSPTPERIFQQNKNIKRSSIFPNITYIKEICKSNRTPKLDSNEVTEELCALNRNNEAKLPQSRKTSIKRKSKLKCNQDKNKVTVVIKCDLVRQSTVERDRTKGKFKVIRDSTVSPVIKSISKFDFNDPLTEKHNYGTHQRGKSEDVKLIPKKDVLSKLGNLEDALKKAQFLIDNKPQDENYLYFKGRILEKLERNSEAEKCFKDALDINPKFSQVAFYLAAIENK